MRSSRLRAILDLIPAQGVVADIGTDHALVPIALRSRGQSVIATEVGAGPYEASQSSLARHGAHDVDLRIGDGLGPLSLGEVDAIVIAGMGGDRVRRILSEGRRKARSAGSLVLQPNTRVASVRRFIATEHWVLADERLAQEDDKFYVALLVHPRRCEPPRWTEADIELGPILRRHGGPAFAAFIEQRRTSLATALERAKQGGAGDERIASLRRAAAMLDAEL